MSLAELAEKDADTIRPSDYRQSPTKKSTLP
jgi:hypothetical protein